MKKILILFAHPAFEKSRVNKILIKRLSEISNVTFHDLYELYPNFEIDVQHEQRLLVEHDVVIMMHPFFWYSTPAILKEWQDLVLEHGWAYGSKGDNLSGKTFLNIISTGGKKEAYQEGGFNNFTIRQFLAPLEQTARLCKMHFLPPFTTHGTHSIQSEEVDKRKDQILNLLQMLMEDKINPVDTSELITLNEIVEKAGN